MQLYVIHLVFPTCLLPLMLMLFPRLLSPRDQACSSEIITQYLSIAQESAAEFATLPRATQARAHHVTRRYIHFTLHRGMLHEFPHHVTPRHATLHHAAPRYTTLHHATPRCITLHHATPHYTTPRHATPRYNPSHLVTYTTPRRSACGVRCSSSALPCRKHAEASSPPSPPWGCRHVAYATYVTYVPHVTPSPAGRGPTPIRFYLCARCRLRWHTPGTES